MTRVLRYPRMSACACGAAMLCALGRDACLSAGLAGWARVLLVLTAAMLLIALVLMSCRLFVDTRGVGVGFLLRARRARWDDIASFGLLYCNSRRQYVYGMYRGQTDFINLLHRAPQCGSWGFVVPVSRKLVEAISMYCPFEVDLSVVPWEKRPRGLRRQWHQAFVYGTMMLPTAAVACLTAGLMLVQAATRREMTNVAVLTLSALALVMIALTLLYRLLCTMNTCPAFSSAGVCAGRGLYLPWERIRFGYVHRIARMSGLFLLSQPLETVHRRGAPPMLCLSMPDTQTMLLAYLMYCPSANKGMEI